jgi:hypothetical protein
LNTAKLAATRFRDAVSTRVLRAKICHAECLPGIKNEFAQAAFACRGPASREGKGALALAADEANPHSAGERLDAHHVVGNDAEDAS